jgi:hypothetical protein
LQSSFLRNNNLERQFLGCSIKPVRVNAYFSIRDNFDPDSNVIEVSDQHRRKQPSHNNSTDAGITSSIKPVRVNAYFSIRDNLDPDSNVIEVSDPHRRKQFSHNNSTDAGITSSIKPLIHIEESRMIGNPIRF